MTIRQEILFSEQHGQAGNLGLIRLNRPEVMNALTHDMILAMHAQLQAWATAEHIKAVVICAIDGPAFCAGADLRALYEHHLHNRAVLPYFFRDEYQLNHCIFYYPKPYITLLDGITMGGGAGIAVHGSHRVATERLQFAMPETSIGFFPDVGGSYFLSRLPKQAGTYLGLTSANITSNDCIALGIAQYKIQHALLPNLIDTLAASPLPDSLAVTQLIEKFHRPTPTTSTETSALIAQLDSIESCFSLTSIEDILQALEQAATPFCKESITLLSAKAPTSLKVTLRALREGSHLGFDACLHQEYRLACHFLWDHDFFEGIRATIIDKDHTPYWSPGTLADVTPDKIDKYFGPLVEGLF